MNWTYTYIRTATAPIVYNVVDKLVCAFDLRITGFVVDVQVTEEGDTFDTFTVSQTPSSPHLNIWLRAC